jgi:serine/threonine protein kinase
MSEPQRSEALQSLPVSLRQEVADLLAASETPLAARLEQRVELGGTLLGGQIPLWQKDLWQKGLLQGLQLDHYRLEETISDEAFGLVFKAVDVRDQRPVAVKILAPELASSQAWQERFEREIRALRTVSHPGIVRLLEHGEAAGFHYFGMELIEGETLRESLRNGALSPNEAERRVREMAEALQAAHKAGFLHNDLKPENIMVRSDGHIVLIDFGLTRPLTRLLTQNGSSDQNRTATHPGSVSGTIRYLSPERVAGKTPDERSDIFSLGILLQEMLTGKQAFARANPLAAAAAILHEEPAALPEGTPHAALIKKCLAKQPDQRPSSLDEFLRLLNTRENARKATPALAWLVAAVLTLGIAVWAGLKLLPNTANSPVTIEPLRMDIALSPDGKYLAFTSNLNNKETLDIYLEDLQNGKTVQVTRTNSVEREPSFSPDGRSLVYMTMEQPDGGIFTVPVDGNGGPHRIGPRRIGPRGFRPRWSPDGKWIIYSSEPSNSMNLGAKSEVFVMPADGSAPPKSLAGTDINARTPIWLKDGSALITDFRQGRSQQFLRIDPKTGATVETIAYTAGATPLIPLEATKDREVLCLRWDSSSVQQGELMTFSLDQRTLRPVGAAEQPSQRYRSAVMSESGGGFGLSIGRKTQVLKLSLKAGSEAKALQNLPPNLSGFSIDYEDRWAYLIAAGHLYQYDPKTGQTVILKGRKTSSSVPLLSQSPSRLYWRGAPDDALQQEAEFMQELPGGTTTVMNADAGIVWDLSFSGDRILRASRDAPYRIEVFPFRQGQTEWASAETQFSMAPWNLYLGAFSPDGRWATFTAEAAGLPRHCFVARIKPGLQSGSREWIALPPDAQFGRWSMDMQQFFYVSRVDGHFCLYSVDIDPASGKLLGNPKPLAHYHDYRFPLVSNLFGQFRLSVSRNAIYFPQAGLTSKLIPLRLH